MPKPTTCDSCPKMFASKSSLSSHKKTHNGVRYNCTQCNKSFSQKTNLKTHFLIHSGEKSHKCKQCNYSSSRPSDLRMHIMTHKGKKRTSAHSATIHAVIPQPSKRITRSTLGINFIIAINVNIKQHNQATWRRTRRRTRGKSHKGAQYASFQASQQVL